MALDPEIQNLAGAGRFDALESLWIERAESTPKDTRFFLDVVEAFVLYGQEDRATELLPFLFDALQSDGATAFEFTRRALVLWPGSPELRSALFDTMRRAYADRPSLDRLMQHFRVAEATDPHGAIERLEVWLRFDVGRVVLVQGRGLGKIAEINPALGSIRVDLPGTPRMTLKLAEAEKLLTALEPGHYLLEKLERPDELRALAESDSGALLEKVFASSRGPLAPGELREMLSGIVPESRWTSWWKRAAADPRLVSSGTKRSTYTWSASGEAAAKSIQDGFDRAEPRAKLELARKHAGRDAEFDKTLARGVLGVARGAHDDPALALEAWLTLQRLDVQGSSEIAAKAIEALLVGTEDPGAIIAAVEERALRDRALVILRDRRPDWSEIYLRLLRTETDARTLGAMYDALRESDETTLARTVDDVLARPHTAPRFFLWTCRELRRRPELDARGDGALLRRLLAALGTESLKGIRAPIRELFDAGEVAMHIAARLDREQSAQVRAMLDREAGLEEHRKDALRRILLQRHPDLREEEDEALYTTTDGLDRKRAEFEQITKHDLPRNAEEIRKAAAHGDLRENFEYKAARERHEMLSSRAKSLHDDLRRARAIDPAAIDASRIRVGTRVVLEPQDGGARKVLTILGPWDSDPQKGVVSYLAPAVQALLGKAPGDAVGFLDGRYVVGAIEVWRAS